MSDRAVVAPPDRTAATLLDLKLEAERLAAILAGVQRQDFLADRMLQDATMFHLLRIAERVRRLDPEVMTRFPDLDWSALGRFTVERAYAPSQDDLDEAWELATRAVPSLLRFDYPVPEDDADLDRPVEPGGWLRFALPEAELAAFCRRWRIAELAVFGSALREDFRPDSDVDFLVTFEEDAGWDLLDQLRMQDELRDLLGRDVDLVERRLVEVSPNWIRRRSILTTARPVHGCVRR